MSTRTFLLLVALGAVLAAVALSCDAMAAVLR